MKNPKQMRAEMDRQAQVYFDAMLKAGNEAAAIFDMPALNPLLSALVSLQAVALASIADGRTRKNARREMGKLLDRQLAAKLAEEDRSVSTTVILGGPLH